MGTIGTDGSGPEDRTPRAPPPFATFADGHRETVLCEAVLESHKKRGWVGVEDVIAVP